MNIMEHTKNEYNKADALGRKKRRSFVDLLFSAGDLWRKAPLGN